MFDGLSPLGPPIASIVLVHLHRGHFLRKGAAFASIVCKEKPWWPLARERGHVDTEDASTWPSSRRCSGIWGAWWNPTVESLGCACWSSSSGCWSRTWLLAPSCHPFCNPIDFILQLVLFLVPGNSLGLYCDRVGSKSIHFRLELGEHAHMLANFCT